MDRGHRWCCRNSLQFKHTTAVSLGTRRLQNSLRGESWNSWMVYSSFHSCDLWALMLPACENGLSYTFPILDSKNRPKRNHQLSGRANNTHSECRNWARLPNICWVVRYGFTLFAFWHHPTYLCFNYGAHAIYTTAFCTPLPFSTISFYTANATDEKYIIPIWHGWSAQHLNYIHGVSCMTL